MQWPSARGLAVVGSWRLAPVSICKAAAMGCPCAGVVVGFHRSWKSYPLNELEFFAQRLALLGAGGRWSGSGAVGRLCGGRLMDH